MIQKYKGTHNFHNYSKGVKAGDKSSFRYILDMKAELLDKSEMEKILGNKLEDEYIKITLLGQSFIYHQIRKMVGMIVNIFQD